MQGIPCLAPMAVFLFLLVTVGKAYVLICPFSRSIVYLTNIIRHLTPVGCHSAKMAPLTLRSTMDLSHPSIMRQIRISGFLCNLSATTTKKNGVNTALCWSYVQSWKCIQHVWKLNLNVFWQEGSRPVYFGYMSAFPALLNVTMFISMYQILVIQYTRPKHWFLYTVYHLSRYCVWIKPSPDFRPLRSETVWIASPTPPWNCPWPKNSKT